jgi:hypothetical protein
MSRRLSLTQKIKLTDKAIKDLTRLNEINAQGVVTPELMILVQSVTQARDNLKIRLHHLLVQWHNENNPEQRKSK